jgi:hypothetical protein
LKLRFTFVCCALFVWTQLASAETVVVVGAPVRSSDENETLTLLHGELASVGLEAVTAERPTAERSAVVDLRGWLEQLAEERKAIAVVEQLEVDGENVLDVWVRKAPGRFEVTRVKVEPGTTNIAARLAIRAIEALRASLLEVDWAARYRLEQHSPKPPPEPTPTPKAPRAPHVQQAPTSSHATVGLELGATVLVSPGGVNPSILPTVRVNWAVRSSWLLEAVFAGLGSHAGVTTRAGTARVTREYGLLGGSYRPWNDRAWWPFFSIATGVLHTSVDGQSGGELTAHDVDQWSALVDTGLGVVGRIYGSYHLSLSGDVQWAQPYVAIHFDEPTVATTGRPNLLLTLAVGAWL